MAVTFLALCMSTFVFSFRVGEDGQVGGRSSLLFSQMEACWYFGLFLFLFSSLFPQLPKKHLRCSCLMYAHLINIVASCHGSNVAISYSAAIDKPPFHT